MSHCYILILMLSLSWIFTGDARPGLDSSGDLPQRFIYRIVRQLSRIPIDASEAMLVPRGSPEETRRILNEIEKINMAFGYTRKSEVTVPRQSVTPQNYFYPRPVVGPSFLQNRRPTFDKSPMRGARTRTWSPFEETTYYYSVPYVRVPLVEKRPLMGFVQDNNARTITKNLLRSELVTKTIEVREPKALVNSIDVKETEPEEPEAPISEYDSEEEIEQEAAPELVEGLINVLPGPNAQEIEDAYDSLSESNEALESAEEEQEEEIPATTINPPLVNDKFLHQEFLQKTPMAPTQLRGFNFSNPFIKGISDRFNKNKNCSITEEHRNSEDMEALSEKPLPDYEEDDAYIEGSKAPWSGFAVAGPANQKDVLKGGGLIIQRLRVRNGSIAIAVAGPGGVATAGSGGTAIVGPDGLAITHPRSLTIAGQGARVYEVPETTDLQKQLLALDATGVPKDGKLVAVGPAIHYNGE